MTRDQEAILGLTGENQRLAVYAVKSGELLRTAAALLMRGNDDAQVLFGNDWNAEQADFMDTCRNLSYKLEHHVALAEGDALSKNTIGCTNEQATGTHRGIEQSATQGADAMAAPAQALVEPVGASLPKDREEAAQEKRLEAENGIADWYSRVGPGMRFSINVGNGVLEQDNDGPWVLRHTVDAALDLCAKATAPLGVVNPDADLVTAMRAEIKLRAAIAGVLHDLARDGKFTTESPHYRALIAVAGGEQPSQ